MIKKILFLFVILINVNVAVSQDFSALWEGHFSYFNIVDVSQGNDKIYAAAENAIFSYDLSTNEIEKTSTINGLSGEIISTIHYSESLGVLIIGYVNGLIEVVSDTSDDILTVVDIVDKETIPPNTKRINHFNEYNGLVYISTDFGISVYDLTRLEFGDTYFIGDLGTQKVINQTTVSGDYIYTASATGIQRALVNNSNLIDYNQWETISTSNWNAIEAVDDKLYAVGANRIIHEVVNSAFTPLFTYSTLPVDVKSANNSLIITIANTVYVYDSNFTLLDTVVINTNFDTDFTSGIIDPQGVVYAGTEDFGVLTPTSQIPAGFQEIHPDGPLLNNSFSIEASSNDLWVAFGDYDLFYNAFPLRSRGLSRLVSEAWNNIPFDSLFGARNLNNITFNPDNPGQVFISSFNDGILEINDGVPTILYDDTNSGLESLILPNDPNAFAIRVAGSNFDSNGLLWSVTSLVDRVLKSYNPSTGQWQGYSFSSLITNPFSELGLGDEVVIDNNGTKFIGAYSFGLIGFNENGNLIRSFTQGDDTNMPSDFVSALVIDKRNQLWIGTNKGLRVLFNTSTFFSDENAATSSIIILEEGVPKELLFQQFITDIEVDGSNNKWIATNSSGLFFLSSDGQETIFHFTKDNSPLPSNNINDVAIDQDNGRVYIATDKGLVSFRAGGSNPSDALTDAFVYPNPVRPTFNIADERVKIKGISDNVNIKITDIEGNLVAEAQSRTNSRYQGYNLEVDGGTVFWNGKNLANNIVSSGVYLIMLSDLDTFETKVLKLMVVR